MALAVVVLGQVQVERVNFIDHVLKAKVLADELAPVPAQPLAQ